MLMLIYLAQIITNVQMGNTLKMEIVSVVVAEALYILKEKNVALIVMVMDI